MKKFKKVVSLLMISAILVLPTAIPVQAKAVENTNKNIIVTSIKNEFNFKYKAKITASDVRLRRTASKSGEVMLLLKKGAVIYVPNILIFDEKDGTWWRPCKYTSGGKTYYGYVADQYVKLT